MHSNTIWNPPFTLNFGYPSKKPTFRTLIQMPVSGRGEIRASLQPYPLWEITYDLDHARGGEQDQNSVYQYLLGFFLSVGGAFSDFLYLDPNDNTATQEFIGVGDGSTTQFQMIHSIGIGTDIVQNPLLAPNPPQFFLNGVQTTAFTQQATGFVLFDTPPGNGIVITWTGNFYYRVRFEDDDIQFDQFMDKLWSAQSIKLKSVIL